MQIDCQEYLKLCEKTNTLCFLDIESTGLNGDYNSMLVCSIKTLSKPPVSFISTSPGKDLDSLRALIQTLTSYNVMVTYYGKGFDIPFLNARLLKWKEEPLPRLYHIDLYYILRANIKTSRKSQSHLLSWLDTPEQKMSVSADVWNKVACDPETSLKVLKKRCESDVIGLEALYKRTKHLIKDIRR